MKKSREWYIGLSINVLLGLSLLGGSLWYFNRPQAEAKQVNTGYTPQVVKPVVKEASLNATEIIQLTNDYRATKGLQPLVENELLDRSACAKAQHMIDNNYWAHVAPDGTLPWYFFEQAGYPYDHAGENLAYGYTTTLGLITGWGKSPLHEKNLVGEYTETGVCIKPGLRYQGQINTTLVVAHYGTTY